MNNFMQMMQAFNQFKASFNGDPKAEIDKLLQSGRITQDDLNRAQEMAKQLQALFK